MSNLSPIELAWIVVAVATLGANLILLRQALVNKEAVALMDGKARRLVANGNLRRELGHVLTQALLLLTGLLAGIVPPPALPEVAAGNVLTALSLIVIQLVVLGSAYIDTRDRKALLAIATRYISAGPLEIKKVGKVVTVEAAEGASADDVEVQEVGGTAVITPATRDS